MDKTFLFIQILSWTLFFFSVTDFFLKKIIYITNINTPLFQRDGGRHLWTMYSGVCLFLFFLFCQTKPKTCLMLKSNVVIEDLWRLSMDAVLFCLRVSDAYVCLSSGHVTGPLLCRRVKMLRLVSRFASCLSRSDLLSLCSF